MSSTSGIKLFVQEQQNNTGLNSSQTNYLVFIIITFIASMVFTINKSIAVVGYVILAIVYLFSARFVTSIWSSNPSFQLFELLKTFTAMPTYIVTGLRYTILLLIAVIIIGFGVDVVLVNKYMFKRAQTVKSLNLLLSKNSNNNRKGFNWTIYITAFALIFLYLSMFIFSSGNTWIGYGQAFAIIIAAVSIGLNMMYTYRLRTIVHDSTKLRKTAENIKNEKEYNKHLNQVYGQNIFTDLWQRMRIFFSNP